APAGPLHVLEAAPQIEAALAHARRRLGCRLVGHAGIELIAARPSPGCLAARGAAADLAIAQLAEFGTALGAHAPGRLVGLACGEGLDLVVRLPRPLARAPDDAAVDRPVLQLARDLSTGLTQQARNGHALERRRRLGRRLALRYQLLFAGEGGSACAAGHGAGDFLVLQAVEQLLAVFAQVLGRRPLGRKRFQLGHHRPGPSTGAALAVAGAQRILQSAELLSARVAHALRGIASSGRHASPQAEGLVRELDPCPAATGNPARHRLGAQPVGKGEFSCGHRKGSYGGKDSLPKASNKSMSLTRGGKDRFWVDCAVALSPSLGARNANNDRRHFPG